MNTVRWFCTGLNTVLLASLSLGCGGPAKQPPPLQPQTPPFETTVTPIAVRDLDLPVKEGSMPLAYLVETTGGVRVVDLTTSHALAKTTVPGRTIVSIDEQHGVSIGGTLFAPGPLPEDHRYGVYFDAGGFTPEDDIRTSTERGDPAIAHEPVQTVGPVHSNGQASGGSTTGPSPHR